MPIDDRDHFVSGLRSAPGGAGVDGEVGGHLISVEKSISRVFLSVLVIGGRFRVS